MTPARDTIYALSSGALPAAIAVVRVSGPAAGTTLAMLAGKLPPPRRAVSAVLQADGEVLDQALVLWLPGPSTATGEDTAELHLHGSRAIAAAVLTALGGLPGLRQAEAGEFTRRAFLNGRLDLAQAEGLADLLAAETEAQRRQAMRQVEGGLGRLVEGWRTRLLSCAAQVEAAIEFGEEEPDVPALASVDLDKIAQLAAEMRQTLDEPPAERLRDGVRIVLAGPVNAGKSSLINALSGRDAAIVSSVAGTTRDLVEVPVAIAGMPCLLIDSAGLRSGAGQVEQLGILRTKLAMEDADLILWLGTPSEAPPSERTLVVHAKADLRPAPLGVDVASSTVLPSGMDDLRQLLIARVRDLLPPSDGLALNARQRDIVAEAATELETSVRPHDPLLVAEHLRRGRDCLDRITGRAGVEEMLDALFGRFCIGK